ncbi:MAG TPA: T9SS type A sorting domain-containing protein [Ignavibacteriaceae bacterium]|nr:T9SS type A sorting domain-containing protein [Ignavibacteriaceae bacterium]
MYKKLTVFLAVVMMLAINYSMIAQPIAYTFDSNTYSYGTVDLSTGAFTSLNFFPQGNSMQAVTGDNDGTDSQYSIVANTAFNTFYLWDINFNTLSGDSIGVVGPFAAGQTVVKGMAHNTLTDTWYVVSSNDFGTAAYLYTINVMTGALTQVGQITGANSPTSMAIDCDGNAYIVDVVIGVSATAIFKSLNLTTAAATTIGTDLGFANSTAYGHDLDFNPETGNLYWGAYWSSGFFSSGGSFRQINVSTGTSTEITPLGQYQNYISFSVNGLCPVTGPIAYTFDSNTYSYGTVDLSTGAFTSLNFFPQGNSMQAVTGDNNGTDSQYSIVANTAFNTFYLWDINFNTLSGDSIGVVGPFAAGQTVVKGMAHNTLTDTWYVVSSNDFGTAAYLYTINVMTGALTQVGQITGANSPTSMAIDCDGNAYIVDVVIGVSATAIFKSLNLTTAAATTIGTDLGFANSTAYGHDLDFNPETGNLYWGAYWSSGFFSSGGSFRQINVTTGTSTEITPLGQYQNYISFSVNGTCTIVPVELTSFSANVNDGIVVLNWSTATELNNSGFEVERKSQNTDWMRIGFVSGSGSTTEIRKYSYSDNSVTSGSYSYRLKQVDFDGTFEYSQEVNVDVTPSMDYALQQNYPNPFNPATKIRFTVPEASIVNLTVYNAIGEAVKEIVNNYYEVGSHEVIFNASNLASGIYFVRMESGSFVSTRKITLMK